MAKGRILSGMRPTGKLHLGHLVGALENWVQLQNEYESFHMVADWHVLTTSYQDTANIKQDTLEMVADWISSGLDPEKAVLFVQSKVKEHAELHLLFSMLVTTARLERNPTVKEVVRDLNLGTNVSYGLLGYPVLQAADILMYKADLVPVGEDQVSHVELTREIARRFNSLYGEVFPEPQPKLTVFARLPGLDGKRMSKSVGNTIELGDSPEEMMRKMKTAVTDPKKIRRGDAGHPEVCTVFTYHKRFNAEEKEEIEKDCRSGVLGCVPCKENAARKVAHALAPIREKRTKLMSDPSVLEEIIEDGTGRARAVARETMNSVRSVMKLWND
ncbi:MAG: tryptophan--tRNA ligase [Candidatus Eiseniibacteriota bacterium]|nr:MAG: tryptophan--tRNA ligase [Candidatus Eisenbacteria bacterium]